MPNSVNEKIKEFMDDISELKSSGSATQNEIWANQVRQFFYKLNIAEQDLRDFDRLFNEMRNSTSVFRSNTYDTMSMFLKLLSRKDLSYKSQLSPNIPKTNFSITDLLSNTKQGNDGFKISSSRRNKTAEILKSLTPENATPVQPKTNKIFIVHGSDAESKLELANMLKEMGLDPIILHQQANSGKTVIEKFEEHAGEVNFAFVLFTPDDVGGSDKNNLQKRARQNVILEFGYFLGKLGRKRVCCLYKKGIELPSDINGLVYIQFDENPRNSYLDITKELKAAGYQLKSL